jgi:hypothetical protein
MLMEKDGDEGPTARISSEPIISESEDRFKKEAASDEKVKRLSQ